LLGTAKHLQEIKVQVNYGRFQWYTQWCEPVVVALYKHQVEIARNLLDLLDSVLQSDELPTPDIQCLRYQYAYLRFQLHLTSKDRSQAIIELPVIEHQLNIKCELPLAEEMRKRLLLQLRINLDRLEIKQLFSDEFDQLFDVICPSEHNTELWFYISGWAFRHCRVDLLEQAYAFSVMQARGFQVNWNWQRVNIMLKLVRGDASRDDLIWLIDNIALEQHLRSIQRDIWPRARELGLVDRALELRMQERECELAADSQARIDQMLQPFIQRQQSNNPPAASQSG
jgi:hypothetical protein